MYKVLDVREIVTVHGGSVNNGVYGGSSSYGVDSDRSIVVIAEDKNKHRKRFEFGAAYRSEFRGETRYYGYVGDYNILVPGDYFEIEETSTYPWVKLKML